MQAFGQANVLLKRKKTHEEKRKKIHVFTDWDSLDGASLMGELTAQHVRGKEVFFFAYNASWMVAHPKVLFLDPNLGFYKGKQYLPDEKSNFGIFPGSYSFFYKFRRT